MNEDVVANADGTDFTVLPGQVIITDPGMGARATATLTIVDGCITEVDLGGSPDFRAIAREITRGG